MFFFFKEENSPSFCMLQKNKTGLAFSCGFVHFGSRSLSGCVTEIHECDGLGKRRKLRATRRNNSQLCRASDVGSCSVRVGSGVQTDVTTPNIVGPTMLGVVAFVLAVVSKRTQQLPILSGQQCWQLLCSCWQWCPNGRNNSQYCRANNVGSCCVRVGSGVQTDATTPNDIQQGVQTVATCNIQQYWELRAIQQCCVRLPRALQGQGRQNQAALSPSKFFGQLFVKIKTKIPRSVRELRFIRIVFIVGSEMKILKVFLD